MNKEIYKYLGSVDAINEKIKTGKSFRDAYRDIAQDIREGKYKPVQGVEYTHAGSIGNLALTSINEKLKSQMNNLQVENYLDFHERFYATCNKEYQ